MDPGIQVAEPPAPPVPPVELLDEAALELLVEVLEFPPVPDPPPPPVPDDELEEEPEVTDDELLVPVAFL